jgi:acyl dehydratase
VTREEIVEFASAYDPQPFHVDDAAARESPFGGLIASGWHTAALWMRLYVDAVLSKTASLGSPGVEELRWLRPVRPGDTLTGTARILWTKPSERDARRGTVFAESELVNQDGEVVMRLRARGLFGRRPAA